MLNLFLIAALIPIVPGLFFLIYFLNLLPLLSSKNTSADRLVKSINGGLRGFNFSTKLVRTYTVNKAIFNFSITLVRTYTVNKDIFNLLNSRSYPIFINYYSILKKYFPFKFNLKLDFKN